MIKNIIVKSSMLASLLALFCAAAWAQNDSGNPGVMSPAQSSPALSKSVQALPDGETPVMPRSRVNGNREIDFEPSMKGAFESAPIWQQLDALSLADRQNASIRFEVLGDLSPSMHRELRVIENLWNSGQFDQAVRDLRILEQNRGVKVAVGIAWKEPKLLQGPDWYNDQQVETRGSSEEMFMDSDSDTGNIFVVIRRQDPAGSPRWTVNISKNDGKTWSETYNWSGGYVIDAGATIVDDYLYIGYVTDVSGAYTEARIRRMFKSDGSVDNVYFYQTVFDKGVDIDEIAVTSNRDFFDNRIYYLAILSDGTLAYYWDEAFDGTTFSEIATGITDADRGLDAATNENFTANFLVASYVNTSNRLNIALKSGSWNTVDLDDALGDTAISAHDNVILCVYEFDPGAGTAIKYMISYDDGANWFYGWIAQPAAGESYFNPDVALRQGGGMSVIWQEEVGEPDIMWYRRRDYPQGSAWSSPEQFNQQDVVTGTHTEIEVLPPLPGFARAYGASFITDQTNRYTLFDRNDEVPGPLTADRTKIFAGAGQKVLLNLNAGPKNAGRSYLMLGSVSGTFPGTPLPGGFVTLPLNWDIFTALVIDLLNTAVFSNFSGNLNGSGQAQAVFNTLSAQPGAVGLTVYFAFALSGPWDFASNAVSLPFVN